MNADDRDPAAVSDDDLLDWALGRVEGPDGERIEQALRGSAELRHRADAVHRTLALLDKDKVSPPGEDLLDRVLERVRAARVAPPGTRRPARPSIFSLAEIGAVAAALLLLALVFVPGAMKAHATMLRQACQHNQRRIGVALEHYANSNGQLLPLPRVAGGANWLNRDRGRQATGTWPLFQLVANELLKPEDVICGATGDRAFKGEPTRLVDFPESANCSYSFQNLFAAAAAEPDAPIRRAAMIDRERPRPILADRNPLFRTGEFCGDVSCTSNSYNHGREGQNVLFTDGRVRWIDRPEVDGDNIWLCGSTRQYSGTETTTEPGDWFFAP